MSQASKDYNTTAELRSETENAVREAPRPRRRPRPYLTAAIPKVASRTKKLNSRPKVLSPTYVYEIRVDGVVRYIGKGRNGRMYSHMIEAQRTANKPGVKIANLSPYFRKMLVRAIRRGAKIEEKIAADNLTDQEAYTLERQMIGNLHKHHAGQLWNTIDERFMSPEYLPDEWSNPVNPLYKVPRPLTATFDSYDDQEPTRFFGQVPFGRMRTAK